MNLDTLRGQIDAVDRELLALLNRRTELSTAIGACKRLAGSPVFAPEREAALLCHLEAMNQGPMRQSDLRAIYREILSASRACQSSPRIAVRETIAGPAALAARLRFGTSDIYLSCPDIQEMLSSIEKRQVEIGILTIEEFAEMWSNPKSLLRSGLGTRWHVCGDIKSPTLRTTAELADDLNSVTGKDASSALDSLADSYKQTASEANASAPSFFLLGRDPCRLPSPQRTVLLVSGPAKSISIHDVQLAMQASNIKVVTAEPLKYSARGGDVCYHVAIEGVFKSETWSEMWQGVRFPAISVDVVGSYSEAASYG